MQILASLALAALPLLLALPAHAAPKGHQEKAGPFKSAAASFYQVGTDIPGIGFKTPISWAGLMPLEHNYELTPKSIKALYTEDTAQAYWYWLWRSEAFDSDDLVLWLTGGPGCSSLNALFTENGPIEFNDLRRGPKPAEHSWTRHAHMIFLDQPGNTGFSKYKDGTYDTGNDVSADIYRFMTNFYRVYPEFKGKKFWITGESYAGTYIPNAVDYFYKQAAGSFNLQGSLIINGLVGSRAVQQGVTVYKDTKGFQKEANVTDADLAILKKESDTCGWTEYTEKYSQYPALKGAYPGVPHTEDCKAYDAFAEALENGNPFLDPYDVRYRGTEEYFEHIPFGNPNARPVPVTDFLSTEAIQSYIHAPRRNFTLCDSEYIDGPAPFIGWNEVHKPIERSLPSSIRQSVRTIVAHGRFDGVLLQHGLQISLQNMTWLGEQGIPQAPTTPFLDIKGRPSGFYTHSRKLSLVIVDRSGHMIPGDNAAAGMLLLQAMLGHRRLDGSPLIVEE